MDAATFLTPELLKYAEHRVDLGGFEDVQAFVRSLVLAEQERDAEAWLRNMVAEAEASGIIETSIEELQEMMKAEIDRVDQEMGRKAG